MKHAAGVADATRRYGCTTSGWSDEDRLSRRILLDEHR